MPLAAEAPPRDHPEVSGGIAGRSLRRRRVHSSPTCRATARDLAVTAHRETMLDRAARWFDRYRTFILLVAAYLIMRAAFCLVPTRIADQATGHKEPGAVLNRVLTGDTNDETGLD